MQKEEFTRDLGTPSEIYFTINGKFLTIKNQISKVFRYLYRPHLKLKEFSKINYNNFQIVAFFLIEGQEYYFSGGR